MSSSPSRMQDPFHSTQKQYPRCFLQRQIVWACLISIKADCCHGLTGGSEGRSYCQGGASNSTNLEEQDTG
jgi:hypothetical protein